MAKRSVRKQRREETSPAREPARPQPTPASPSPPWRSPAFWLGGLVIGLAVAAIAVAAFVLTGAGDDETPVAATATATPGSEIKSAEELQAEFDQRDREQIEELTKQADELAATLRPVMSELEKALPYAGAPGPQAPDDQVEEWLDTARDAAKPYQESISGGTGHNVARSAIRAALDGLVGAIATYQLAGEPGADREAILDQAAAQRENAIRTWSAAGIQIDAINVDAGFGHQHVPQLAGAAAGGQAPDTLPEGTDARPQE
jgi:hypothetical protein